MYIMVLSVHPISHCCICTLFTGIPKDVPAMRVTSLYTAIRPFFVSRDSVFSPALLLLSAIPSGETGLLIMQHIILLASLSGELLCRISSRIWSQAKRSIHCIAAQQDRQGEGKSYRDEKDMVAWSVR